MTRVALYARYSSDNQPVASIDDQLRICREKAEREKWAILSTYKDGEFPARARFCDRANLTPVVFGKSSKDRFVREFSFHTITECPG